MPFAAVSAFLALIQVLCIGLSVIGIRIGQPLAILVLLAAAVAAAWFAAQVGTDAAPAPATVSEAPAGVALERVLSAGVWVVLLWAAWVWVDLLRLAWYRPPLFWDSLVYHIPAIHDWVQQGRVRFVHSVPDIPLVNNPMGVEVTAFLVHQITGTSRLVDASNLWYWPLGVTALAVIAAELGARGVWCWLAGALLFGVPIFVGQGATAYIDAGFATTVMGSLAAACVFVSPVSSGRWWGPVLLGLNVGLMLGSKGSGLPFALVVSAVVCAAVARTHARHRLGSLARAMLVSASVAVAVGGYWSTRNAVLTGNPLSPFHFQFGRRVIGAGFDRQFLEGPVEIPAYPRWTWRFVAWMQPDAPIYGPVGAGNRATTGGLGYMWIAGAVPAVAYLWLMAIRRRPSRSTVALAVVTASVGILFVIQPAAWHARYVLWLHALGLPCLAAALHSAVLRSRSHRGHLLTAGLGIVIVGIAVWEGQRTLDLEWSNHRVDQSPSGTPTFVSTLELYFPGMERAAGFKDFLAAKTVARGWWGSSVGTFLGGVLAMPLDARTIVVLPPLTAEERRDPPGVAANRRAPTASDIADAQAAGSAWFLWEVNPRDQVPEPLASFEERYTYHVAEGVAFALFRITPQAHLPDRQARDSVPR